MQLEEHFSGCVHAEQFFLQGHARPIGEKRIVGVENRFIQESDDRESGQTHIVSGVAPAGGFRFRRPDRTP